MRDLSSRSRISSSDAGSPRASSSVCTICGRRALLLDACSVTNHCRNHLASRSRRAGRPSPNTAPSIMPSRSSQCASACSNAPAACRVRRGRVDAREHHAPAPVHHVPDELQCVLALPVRLQPEPVREPRQRLLLAVGGHRGGTGARIELGRDLRVSSRSMSGESSPVLLRGRLVASSLLGPGAGELRRPAAGGRTLRARRDPAARGRVRPRCPRRRTGSRSATSAHPPGTSLRRRRRLAARASRNRSDSANPTASAVWLRSRSPPATMGAPTSSTSATECSHRVRDAHAG